jgi:copper chaperone CopZ
MENTLKLSIEGMHCGACVRRVTNALQAVPSVQVGSVEVGSAQVTFDPKAVAPEQISGAVNGIGFTARVAQ